jgi:hypothetical protein
MALFGPRFERGAEGESRSNHRGVHGALVEPPEVPGSVPRRARMFGEAIEVANRGGDVRGGIHTLFAREATFLKWVSLRGALLAIHDTVSDPQISIGDLRSWVGRAEPAGAVDLISDYDRRISTLSFNDVLADRDLVRTPDWHLEFITWSAQVALADDYPFVHLFPAAQTLDVAGWYAEPVFSKSERFWDGADWTPRCRVLEGRNWRLINAPF